MSKPFDFSDIEFESSSGMDAHFAREEKKIVRVATFRKRIASLGDISDFVRTADESLVHRSSRDLWSLQKDPDGSFYIERLFDDNGLPLKG